jgi:uncharacterized LabA/DUF88 family protein
VPRRVSFCLPGDYSPAALAEAPSDPIWVTVLLDWQNIYGCARDAFGLRDASAIEGTVHPLQLARHLAGGIEPGRNLQELRIYRGRPHNAKDRKSYDAWQSQTSEWTRSCGEMLVGRYRDLRYRGDEIMEKGIDVWLAIDLVTIAMDPDIGRVVVVSSDSDLIPALELAVQMRGEEFAEVAGWDGDFDSAPILDVPGVTQRGLTKTHYERFHDDSDYNVGVRIRRRQQSSQSWASQIEAEGKRRREPS